MTQDASRTGQPRARPPHLREERVGVARQRIIADERSIGDGGLEILEHERRHALGDHAPRGHGGDEAAA